MERRSDKYDGKSKVVAKKSRVEKNTLLYEEANSKIGFDEAEPVDPGTKIDLTTLNLDNPKREDYQKIKNYKDLLGDREERKASLEEIDAAKKTFDINLVLEEAKKSRDKIDETEEKRNIKNEEYNVLNVLNKKYLHNKDFEEEEEHELKELIDTITSNTLKNDVEKGMEEKDLLEELFSTNTNIDKEEIETQGLETNSFYTKSMDLSDSELYEEEGETSKQKGSKTKIIIISIVLLIAVIAIAYLIFKHFGIGFN